MHNRNLELFLCNNKILETVGGFFTNNDLKKCNALSLTLKNQKADAHRINEAIKIIKKSQSVFSNFRGNNLLTIATRISFEIDMQSSFNQINEIYIKLNKHFFKNEYLALTAQLIYDSRNIIDIETTIINTRKAYDYMKKNHMFLTGSQDISAATMIAITTTDFDKPFNEIEEYYRLLKNKGFWAGNNLQSLSHVLVLVNGSVEEKVDKVVRLERLLSHKGISLKHETLPLLGFPSVLVDDLNIFTAKVEEINHIIKKEKGFGMFSLTKEIRDMIVVTLATLDNVTKLSGKE